MPYYFLFFLVLIRLKLRRTPKKKVAKSSESHENIYQNLSKELANVMKKFKETKLIRFEEK